MFRSMLVIVPAHNEENTIGRVLRGLFEHGITDIVVVDDGSTDRTAAVARQSGAAVLRHRLNRGQGAALQTGHEYAKASGADVVAHFDADDQLNPADIAGAVARLKAENLDIILGSRFLDGRSRVPWFKRRVLLPVARWINYVFTGLKLSDAHNGFRVLSRRALEKIVITQDRMAHGSEIPALIRRHSLRYAEYPVEVRYHEFGQGVGGGLRVVADLLLGKLGPK